MNEKNKHIDSLKVIEQMIVQAKYKPNKLDSFVTLQWGYLVMIAALLHWYLITIVKTSYAPVVWLLMLVGLLITVAIRTKQKRKRRAKTYVETLNQQIWIAFGISFAILFFSLQSGHQNFLPLVILLYGIAMWMQGALIKYRPYQLGAIAFWIGSLVAFQFSPDHQLLVLAVAAILGYIVPGHLLYAKTHKADV